MKSINKSNFKNINLIQRKGLKNPKAVTNKIVKQKLVKSTKLKHG
jgi:hypothetical protein